MVVGDVEYVTRAEAAEILRCSISTVKRMEKEKRLKPHRRNKRMVRYRRAEVLNCLDVAANDDVAATVANDSPKEPQQ